MIPENELLDLLNKQNFIVNDFMQKHKLLLINRSIHIDGKEVWIRESLTDLAKRLWGRAVRKGGCCLVGVLIELTDKYNFKDDAGNRPDWKTWWLFWSEDTHKIVATIIALQRSGEEI